MTTMREVVSDAFEEIGVKTAEIALTSDELQSGIRRCNDMLLAWDDLNYIQGYTELLNGDDVLNVERSAIGAIKYNLAVKCAPSYQKTISAGLAANANNTLEMLLASSPGIGEVAYPDSLPMGSGNRCCDIDTDRRFFPNNPEENF